jgi:hypothetical protein
MVWRVLKGAFVASLVLLAMAAMVAGAEAGEYHVYTCRTPSGESAPADGWSGSKTGTSTYAEDTCQQPGGALVAALREQPRTANTDIATWAFGPPAGETIAGATLWRAGDADGGVVANAFYQFWFAGPNNFTNPANAFGQCMSGSECPTGVGNVSQPLSAENRVVVPAANLGSHLYMNASCGGVAEYKCAEGKHDANGYAAVVYLYAADIKLEQNGGPSASNVSGELASAPAVRGTSDVAFDATDPGGGVYEAVFSVDGQVVQSTVVDENGGHCRNVGGTTDGLAAFLYVQPCAGSMSVDVPFDTTKVSDGTHHLVVSVTDAAGNAAPVLDREITVANPPAASVPGPPNGTNASAQATLTASWKGMKKAHVTSRYGHSQTVAGRLTGPGGVPIGGALIDLLDTPAYAGAKPIALASPRTGADGSFSVRLPRGISSGTLAFAYRSHLGDALAVTTRTLQLSVRAGLTLSVAPRTASVGRSIFFKGQLRGGPIPPGGKQLVLEARSAGSGWIEFDVLSTNAKGRYRASYRFKFPGPVGYQFRVVSNHEADFPFATGASNVVRVRER